MKHLGISAGLALCSLFVIACGQAERSGVNTTTQPSAILSESQPTSHDASSPAASAEEEARYQRRLKELLRRTAAERPLNQWAIVPQRVGKDDVRLVIGAPQQKSAFVQFLGRVKSVGLVTQVELIGQTRKAGTGALENVVRPTIRLSKQLLDSTK